jgi:hypothetical protein
MGSPLHVWWTVLYTWLIVTFIWFIFYQIVDAFINAITPSITSGIGLQTVGIISLVWHWWPLEFLLGMLVWVYVQSQKKDIESYGYYPQ